MHSQLVTAGMIFTMVNLSMSSIRRIVRIGPGFGQLNPIGNTTVGTAAVLL